MRASDGEALGWRRFGADDSEHVIMCPKAGVRGMVRVEGLARVVRRWAFRDSGLSAFVFGACKGGSSLNQGPFFNPQHSTASFYQGPFKGP